jgi:hypothetical protein
MRIDMIVDGSAKDLSTQYAAVRARKRRRPVQIFMKAKFVFDSFSSGRSFKRGRRDGTS